MNRRFPWVWVPLLALVFAVAAVRAGDPVPTISQQTLLERQQKKDPALLVVDVRAPSEYAQGHVPGAINVPHDQIAAHLAELPKDKDVVLYCRSGRRSALAAEALRASGYSRLLQLEGDMSGWLDQGRPVEKP